MTGRIDTSTPGLTTRRLITKRLVLRPVAVADAERIAFILNHFAVAGSLGRIPYPYTCRDAEDWLAGRPADARPEETDFAIDLGDHGIVGVVGWRMEKGYPMIGYYLGLPYWGRGIMTEAASAAIDWFFAATTHEAVTSGHFSFNRASARIQAKLGFTETGRSFRHCLARNAQVSHIDTRLTRADWVRAGRARKAS